MSENSAMEYVSTRRERIGWMLFPFRHCDMPDLPKARDCHVAHVTITVSMLDRLRLLISGRAECHVKTATENEIGAHKTNSEFSVLPPRFLSRK